MYVKDKVRRRRQDRIKAIVDEQQLNTSADDERLKDPEYVWHMKDNPWNKHDEVPWANRIRNQIGWSIFLFVVIWGIFQWDNPWMLKGKGIIENSLTEEFQFETIAIWYDDFFQGAPTFIPTFDKNNNAAKVDAKINGAFILPVTGIQKTSFTAESRGIQLESHAEAAIVSIDAGRVIFVGELEDRGLTVVIQHKDQLQSIYGWLGQTSLKRNHWVKGGQRIGTVQQNNENRKGILYFALKQGDQYINPVDVITFD